MKQSVKTRPVWGDLLPAGLTLLLALALFFGFWGQNRGDGHITVVLSVAGEEVARIPLSRLEEPLDYTVQGVDYPLTLRLTQQGARVLESACPGQDCLHTGTVHRSGESIVCLPNHLILRLEGAENAGVDAVIG